MDTALPPTLGAAYRVERPLGEGGMATVYLATDLKHDRRVALKVLRRELAAAVGVERFRREIRIAAGLTHPNILPLYDSAATEIAEDAPLYFVMPYVEGDTLRARLEQLHRTSGRRVSLVGWSLGGLYAQELARAAPGSVRGLVTLGTPVVRWASSQMIRSQSPAASSFAFNSSDRAAMSRRRIRSCAPGIRRAR